jgi:glutamine cyclotransferase
MDGKKRKKSVRLEARGERQKRLKLKVQNEKFKICFLAFLVWELFFCTWSVQLYGESSEKAASVYGYRVLKTFPHDPEAFTQGLFYHRGVLYESTGLLGKSTLRKVELITGRPIKIVRLPDYYFGEGVTAWREKIVQLTWRSRTAIVYDLAGLKPMETFPYGTEGWGITQDGKHLIMSDGTSFLTFRDPTSFKEIRRIQAHDQMGPVTMLNELEYIKGEIWANVYLTNRIARISPVTGQVTGWIDLQGLLPVKERTGKEDVLNGIAFDAERDRLWVTGKFWPKLFEIQLIPRQKK